MNLQRIVKMSWKFCLQSERFKTYHPAKMWFLKPLKQHSQDIFLNIWHHRHFKARALLTASNVVTCMQIWQHASTSQERLDIDKYVLMTHFLDVQVSQDHTPVDNYLRFSICLIATSATAAMWVRSWKVWQWCQKTVNMEVNILLSIYLSAVLLDLVTHPLQSGPPVNSFMCTPLLVMIPECNLP